MRNYFEDKVVIVTGGASGIGRCLCEELGKRNAFVIVADINMKDAERVATVISEYGGKSLAMEIDVSNSAQVKDLITRIITEYKRLDILFNSAGIGLAAEVRDMELVHWERLMKINVSGVVYCTNFGYQAMAEQGFGHIINIASLSGVCPGPMNTAYAMTKHAVVGLSSSLRPEAAALGVKISVVCPGPVKTRIYSRENGLNVDMEALVAKLPFKMMDPAKAALQILSGVRKNKGIMIFPFYAKVLVWVYRHFPWILIPWFRLKAKHFRALRQAPALPAIAR